MNKHDIVAFGHKGASLDELVIFAAQLDTVVSGFERLWVEKPEWLAAKEAETKAELAERLK